MFTKDTTYVIPCTLHTSFMLTQACTYSVDNEVDNWGIGSFLRWPQLRLFWGVEEVQCLDILLTCCLITIRGEEGGRGKEGGGEREGKRAEEIKVEKRRGRERKVERKGRREREGEREWVRKMERK